MLSGATVPSWLKGLGGLRNRSVQRALSLGNWSHGSLQLITWLPAPPHSWRLPPQQAQLVPAPKSWSPAWLKELIPCLANAQYSGQGQARRQHPSTPATPATRAVISSTSVRWGQRRFKLPKLYLPALRRQGSQPEAGRKLVSLFCQASWTAWYLMKATPRIRLSQEKNSINVKMWMALEVIHIPVEELRSTVTWWKAL